MRGPNASNVPTRSRGISRAAFRILCLTTAAIASMPLAAAAIELDVAASPDPARPGELLDLEITVTNSGSSDRTDITVFLDWPEGARVLGDSSFDGDCPGRDCEPGEQAEFVLESLRAGEGLTWSIPARPRSDASDGTVIPWNAEAFDDGLSEATASSGVTVESGRLLELSLMNDQDPVSAGGSLRYTVTFGVRETSAGSPEARISLPVPTGASFIEASDDGSLNASGTAVEWELGNLNPGTSGEVYVSFSIGTGQGNGSIIPSEATFSDSSGASVAYRESTRIEDQPPLRLEVVSSPDPVRPGETLDLELTVTNAGFFDRADVELTLEFPEGAQDLGDTAIDGGNCPGRDCEPGEEVTFLVQPEPLPGEEGRTYSVPMRLRGDVLDGTVVAFEAQVTDSRGRWRESSASVAVHEERDMELGLTERRDPLAPNEELEFVVTVGASETSAGLPGTRVRLPRPSGTSFVAASDGGQVVDDVVEWNLGSLNPGENRERRARFLVDPGLDLGAIVTAQATLLDDDGRELRYETATRILGTLPLELAVIASPDPVRPVEQMDVELRVNNRGNLERTGVEVKLDFPDHVADFGDASIDGNCPGRDCEPRESAMFTGIDLPAGEGRSFTLPVRLTSDTKDGVVLTFEAEATDTDQIEREAGTNVVVRDSRSFDLALVASDEPLLPGGTLDYAITYGVYQDTTGSGDSLLRFRLPEGTSFSSATDGGDFFDGFVEWDLGAMEPGDGGERIAVVEIEDEVEAGHMLFGASAELIDETDDRKEVRFEESARVESQTPLDVNLSVSPVSAMPGTTLDLRASVRNESSRERTGVSMRVRVPEWIADLSDNAFAGNCPGRDCTSREWATFDVGTLAPGETFEDSIPFVVASTARRGTVINFEADAKEESSGFVSTDGVAVYVGDQGDFDGNKDAGAGAVADGFGGSEPLRVSKVTSCDDIELTWEASCLTADDDYAIYSGNMSDFQSYSPLQCSTGGETSVILTPPAGESVFYLVVPKNGVHEGSYGQDATGAERPAGQDSCLPQRVATDCE